VGALLEADFLVAALVELAFFVADIVGDDGGDVDVEATIEPEGGRGRGRECFEWGWLEVKKRGLIMQDPLRYLY
jgi:hypothetical protein